MTTQYHKVGKISISNLLKNFKLSDGKFLEIIHSGNITFLVDRKTISTDHMWVLFPGLIFGSSPNQFDIEISTLSNFVSVSLDLDQDNNLVFNAYTK